MEERKRNFSGVMYMTNISIELSTVVARLTGAVRCARAIPAGSRFSGETATDLEKELGDLRARAEHLETMVERLLGR